MLARLLQPHTERAYALLRIAAGVMLSFHGMQKLFGVLGGQQQSFGTQLWLGAVLELVGGLAVAAGFFAPWAAFLLSGTMAVAYVQFHWQLAAGPQLLPVVNKGELALLYAFVFLFIACRGPGRWSVDGRRR